MPPEAVVEDPKTVTESFSSFRGNRGAAAQPAAVEVKVEDPTDTGAVADPKKVEPAETDPAPDAGLQDETVERTSKYKKRIDALIAKNGDLERRIQEVSRGTGAQPETAKPVATQADPDPQPKRPDSNDAKYAVDGGWQAFEDDKLKFAIDTAKWEMRRDQQVAEQAKAAEAQQRARKEALATFESRGSEYAEEHPDYPELVAKYKDAPMSNEAAAVILNADNGPAILHELMCHPEEMKRIDALPNPIARLDAIYALKYKLLGFGEKPAQTEETPAKPQRSNAPAAGTRLNGAGSSAGDPKSFSQFRTKRFGT